MSLRLFPSRVGQERKKLKMTLDTVILAGPREARNSDSGPVAVFSVLEDSAMLVSNKRARSSSRAPS